MNIVKLRTAVFALGALAIGCDPSGRPAPVGPAAVSLMADAKAGDAPTWSACPHRSIWGRSSTRRSTTITRRSRKTASVCISARVAREASTVSTRFRPKRSGSHSAPV